MAARERTADARAHDAHAAALVYVPSETRPPALRRRLLPRLPPARRDEVQRFVLRWDTVDNALVRRTLTQQALRFVFLLLDAHYQVGVPRTRAQALRRPSVWALTRTLARPTRRWLGQWLVILSEGIANLRRASLLLVWLVWSAQRLGARHTQPRVVAQADAPPTPPAPHTERLALAGEALATLAEGCDMLAFATGAGLFWRALGLRRRPQAWIQRRRRGVERVGVFVSLGALAVQLYVLHVQQRETRDEMHASIGAVQHQLETLDAPDARAKAPDAPAEGPTDAPAADAVAPAPYDQYLANRRRLRWLGIERVCVCSDASFALYEACAPDREKDQFEASTGLLAATLRLLRLWNEARWGALDI
ncbi:hypothetical protein MBRA1_003776 [Malassezia brasiliensis]|uniref:Uncharacterized protein n=1 Tax=Malassezia brasiliensis TaxID=1821822 RepID=A0AAF0IRF1_9BASI|nr:hypothetical protein MBRA1_003776 [Malassezia brasiliensis]